MRSEQRLSSATLERFSNAVRALDQRYANDSQIMVDENQDATVRSWLDDSNSLPWAGDRVTPDEWFFITTLYGTSTPTGQRTLIREYFPRFVEASQGNLRAVTPEAISDWRLRYPWMKNRLCRMAEILDERDFSLTEYVDYLRTLEKNATPTDPTPALDRILADHRAGEGKTLSVFVRDCVRTNCFPIDSRVRAMLSQYGLPENERLLVSLSLATGRNPRQVARMFYFAGE